MITKFNKKIDLEVLNNLNVSHKTIKHYKELTVHFFRFIEQNGYKLKQPILLRYRDHLQHISLKPNTKRSYFNAAKVFCLLLYNLGYIKADLTKDLLNQTIKGFQMSKHHVYGISRAEVKQITCYMSTLPSSFVNDRLKAIISLLLYQGLRQIEVHRLNIEDINFHKNQLFIQGKGRDFKEIVYLHPKTVTALRVYCGYLERKGPLFVSCHNKTKRLAATLSIHYIVKARLRGLKIERSIHGFRHYFVTQLIDYYKGDLAMVSMYTRHRNLSTLQIYNDRILNEKDLTNYYAAVNKFH